MTPATCVPSPTRSDDWEPNTGSPRRRTRSVRPNGYCCPASAKEKLRERGLVETIRSLTQPVLGICIGVQLLCRRSEEGDAECIGIFDNEVRKFTAEGLKVPHMGWNSIGNLRSPLLDGIAEGSYVYYVHSYAPTVNGDTIATTVYGETFSGAINRGNFFGTQFHPEKSASVGERILQNFLTL